MFLFAKDIFNTKDFSTEMGLKFGKILNLEIMLDQLMI